jgi:hypothetical protein
MQDPDREECNVCHKWLKKASMKKHKANLHSKASQDKKLIKGDREVAKKQALQILTKKNPTDLQKSTSYAIPKDADDDQLNRLATMLEDFEFIDIEDSHQPIKKIAITTNAPKKRQQPELAIQKKLEKQYNAGHKVIPYSIIDILGSDFLIEIKNWNDWIKAIGQVFVYGHVYPNHMKQIHFFGEPPSVDKEIYIRAVCAKLGIKVTQEPWPQ